MISWVTMPVADSGSRSARTRIAITTSSSAQLPARSPMPLMVHSICRAPAATASSELATARPRSLWQCTEMHRLVDVGHGVPDLADQVGELLGVGVAHRVGDVDRGGTGPDRRLDAAEQEVGLGARRVHRTPLDVVGVAPGTGDAVDHPLVDLVGLELQLVLAVQRRGADEGVDAAALGRLQGLGRPVDVAAGGTGKPADHRLLARAWRSRGRPRSRLPRRSESRPRSRRRPWLRGPRRHAASRRWSSSSPATARRRARWCRR